MRDWRETTLGEFASLQRGHDLPESVRRMGKVPVMGSFGVTGTHSESKAKGPGVTVGRSGASIGVVSYTEFDYWPLNTCLYVTDFHGNNPRFAYYFLKTLNLASFNSGSAQPSLNRNFIHPIRISVPDRAEQDKIAELLGALDDKIELNRRLNETLEAVARAIFKDWFVDFGPTRAKAEARKPYLASELWALFPDCLDDDDRPAGWEERNVYEFANVIYGAPFASSQFNTEGRGLPLIRIRDLNTHDPTVFTNEEHPKGHAIEPGDIVVGMDGEFRMHIWKGPRSWLNQRVCHFEPLEGIPRSFVSEAIIEPLANFERSKVGTTVIHLGKRDIDTFKLVRPEQGVFNAFSSLVGPMHERIVKNALESRTLGQARDLLLPKLMAGEIRLWDAEKIVEAAA